jgi:2,3-bisphosphoglycerate-independent phosphoglycerate mutase
LGFIKELQAHLNDSVGKIASVSGRYYAMDRDKRWERIKLAYDALVNGSGEKATDAIAAVENSYTKNVTDEFIKPTVIVAEDQQPLATIKDGDVAICFNFRTDRCREITQVLTQMDMPDHGMNKKSLHYTTMTEYDKTYTGVNVIFETDNLNNTLGQVLEQHGLKQIRIAETEKYPHVSFFFSGGREQPFDGEKRIMIASPKVATYDLKPEMSAYEVTDSLLKEISKASPEGGGLEGAADFICLNYANADMVGHTGVWQAAIKAVETVDACVAKVVTAGLENGYTIFLTADHGNSDYMINEDGSPNTAHTLNPVPFFIIDNNWQGKIKPGKLGDIAPTILTMMQLPVPKEMSGEILI